MAVIEEEVAVVLVREVNLHMNGEEAVGIEVDRGRGRDDAHDLLTYVFLPRPLLLSLLFFLTLIHIYSFHFNENIDIVRLLLLYIYCFV